MSRPCPLWQRATLSEKQLQAQTECLTVVHKCLCGQSCLSIVSCVLSDAPSQNASYNASSCMMEMAYLGLRPSGSRRHKSIHEQIGKNPMQPPSSYRHPFLSSHMRPWWGFFRTNWRKNLAWFTCELKQYMELAKTGLVPPHSGVALRDTVKGNPRRAELWAAPSVVHVAQREKGPEIQEDMTSWAWLLAWLCFLGQPEPKHRAYFLPGTHWLLHQSYQVGIFVIPILQIRKLRSRGV